ncbi:MAG: energy transducer TonB, partial [Acidobacteriota bacterium]
EKMNQVWQTETEETEEQVLPESKSEKKEVQIEESAEEISNPEEVLSQEEEGLLNPELKPKEEVKTGDIAPLELVDSPPELIKRVEPKYTRAAKNFRVAGRVVLMILISENGDVIQAKIIRGIKNSYGLNEESEKAVRQWKYKPAVKDGVSVKVWKPVAIGFTGK